MRIIGVTGGIGSGKSRVLSYLESRYQAKVVRLDDLGRACLDIGGPCYDSAVRLFGTSIVKKDGTLDRGAIAGIIFKNENLRGSLDGLIHPEVRNMALREIEKARGTYRFFVIESAILFEAGYGAICDEVWYIYADETTRFSRLAASRGYSEDRIRDTMRRQMTDAEYRARCDAVMDNSGDFESCAGEIDARISGMSEREISEP